jgi:23S rRNA pseudouridine2605 synthase
MDTRTMQERLQKIIARAGVASRRAAEEFITGGRVRVNGHIVTELGVKADPRDDKIEVDGKRITAPSPVYVALHKPRNVVSTLSDPEGRPSVAELLRSVGTRVFPVGRLDFATSGVLLATNDGEFSQGMLHPKKGVPKTYVLKVMGLMEPTDLERWRQGVELEDGRTQPAEVRFLRHEEGKTWFEITIFEGRNQQIRRMGEATGFPVMRLARVSFAGVTHEGIRPGQWRFLTLDELTELRKEFGVPKRVRSADTTGRIGKAFGKVQARGEARPERGPHGKTRQERPEHAREEAPRPPPRPSARDTARDGAPRARPRTYVQEEPARARPQPHAQEDAPRARSRPRDQQQVPQARSRPRDQQQAPQARSRPRDQAQAPQARSRPRDQAQAPQARSRPRDQQQAPQARSRPFPSKTRG